MISNMLPDPDVILGDLITVMFMIAPFVLIIKTAPYGAGYLNLM